MTIYYTWIEENTSFMVVDVIHSLFSRSSAIRPSAGLTNNRYCKVYQTWSDSLMIVTKKY